MIHFPCMVVPEAEWYVKLKHFIDPMNSNFYGAIQAGYWRVRYGPRCQECESGGVNPLIVTPYEIGERPIYLRRCPME